MINASFIHEKLKYMKVSLSTKTTSTKNNKLIINNQKNTSLHINDKPQLREITLVVELYLCIPFNSIVCKCFTQFLKLFEIQKGQRQ